MGQPRPPRCRGQPKGYQGGLLAMLALVHGRELLVAERAVQELPALQICRHPSFEG